jgi:DNA polymerase-3 subunit epsilon
MRIRSRTQKLERAARLLDNSSDYRVLRKIPEPFSHMDGNAPPDAKCVAIVDVETTGLSLAEDEIIELAIMLVWVSNDGEVLAHLGPWSWLNDPCRPLSPQIQKLTGLCDYDLSGQVIDDEKVLALLNRADLVVAHNSSFDVRWFDQRYPQIADMHWACSMSEIDWTGMGFEGRSQTNLLNQHGWFEVAHRAAADVWCLLWLLTQKRSDPDGENVRSHFARLLESAEQPSMLISASLAPFAAKDALKDRGYKWNVLERVWQKQVPLDDASTEVAWFKEKLLPAPTTKTVTAAERYR